MAERFTKFNSNYLMRSQHQRTDLGTIMERDWVTTNGLNVLRFGPGRRIWYNSGNFVFTTSNIPTYHKKHKLTTEIKEWKWDDCKSADGTVNDVVPQFNTTDIRDYTYYGSCVELIRATIEDIISDFPGRLVSTNERPNIRHKYISDIDKTPSFEVNKDDISYVVEESLDDNGHKIYTDYWYYYDGNKWSKLSKIKDESDTEICEQGKIYHDLSDNQVKQYLKVKDKEIYYFESIGSPTTKFQTYFVKENLSFMKYDYSSGKWSKVNPSDLGLIDGFIMDNQFNIDLHHKKVTIGKYDNKMRFMAHSWDKYCIVKNGGKEEKITDFKITDGVELVPCLPDNEGNIIKSMEFTTENGSKYVVNGYFLDGKIVYIYKPKSYDEVISIQPQKEYIDEYFAKLKGFKRQLLRQDTKPLYSNKFITPIEYEFIWYYPERTYIWPSDDYCININSVAFDTFVEKLFTMGQNFDELWSDNIYRSMTHESIKNFDWTYSRDYYEGDAQDNIDGGERMQKILRVFGRVFDDVKVYIDNIKSSRNISYDKEKNGPEALLSDEVNIKGIDVISTILNKTYDIDAIITKNFLDGKVAKEESWLKGSESNHKKWYPTRNSTDIFVDVCDNEMMRRLLLSAKRIMQTKGTQEAIQMMFGLFGYNAVSDMSDDKNNADFIMSEEAYYTTNMIPSEERVDKVDKEGKSWCNDVDWKQVDSIRKGDLAVEINSNKDLDLLYYEDPFSGTPLRIVPLGRANTTYVVPYYDNTQLYDGDLYFQSKGGWAKMFNENNERDVDKECDIDNCYKYQETLSYLHVVGTIGDLLTINPFTLDKNDIYYVVNLNDYTTYDENPPMSVADKVTMSHYFILTDNFNANKFKSWKNIVVQTELDKNGNLQIVNNTQFDAVYNTNDWIYNDGTLSSYEYAFKKMSYLDNIISTNVANNPHVGYGKYDDGNTFIEYMKLPFKFLIDNKHITNSQLDILANKYKFEDIDTNIINDKIQIMDTRNEEESRVKSDFLVYEYNKVDDTVSLDVPEKSYPKTNKCWHINTKLFTIKVNNENIKKSERFKQYFKSVIMPYVMQTIPSTTILKLIDFI